MDELSLDHLLQAYAAQQPDNSKLERLELDVRERIARRNIHSQRRSGWAWLAHLVFPNPRHASIMLALLVGIFGGEWANRQNDRPPMEFERTMLNLDVFASRDNALPSSLITRSLEAGR